MTSHKGVFEEHSADELDRLIQWTLRDSLGRIQPPPAYVWREIKRKVQRRMTSGAKRHAPRDSFYQPVEILGVWGSRVSPSLVCIVEQQMSILRFGWAI